MIYKREVENMKLKTLLGVIGYEQNIIIISNENREVLYSGSCAGYLVCKENVYMNNQVITSYTSKENLVIFIEAASPEIEKQTTTNISFKSNPATRITIESFKSTVDDIVNELMMRGYTGDDYISIVAAGSAYKDGADKSDATIITINLY